MCVTLSGRGSGTWTTLAPVGALHTRPGLGAGWYASFARCDGRRSPSRTAPPRRLAAYEGGQMTGRAPAILMAIVASCGMTLTACGGGSGSGGSGGGAGLTVTLGPTPAFGPSATGTWEVVPSP